MHSVQAPCIVALAPGATDATDITVGIGNGIAGVQTGTVTLDFVSDLGSGNEAPLPSAAITVSGTVYREAVATITPLVLFAHVGDPGVETLNVGNIATADGFSENLIATLTGATGNLSVAGGGGKTGDIAPGASNAATLTLDFSTATAGVLSGNALVSLLSDWRHLRWAASTGSAPSRCHRRPCRSSSRSTISRRRTFRLPAASEH